MVNSTTKKKILFIGEGVTLSHIIRPLFLAQVLSQENYDITFACDKRYRPMIENAGLLYENLSSMSPDEFNKKLLTGVPIYTYDRLKQYIAAEREIFIKIKPDLIVGDFRISLNISSRIEKIPYCCLVNGYWSPWTAHKEYPLHELQITKILGLCLAKQIYNFFGPISFYFHCRDFNKLCHEHRLPAVKNLREMYSQGTWTLYPDTPGIAPTEFLPSNHKYLGPICELSNMTRPEWWGKWPQNKPIIYLSLGSSGDIAVLPLVKDVLKKMDVSVIFTTSGRANTNNLPQNFYVTNYVSGLEVAKVAQLFITNGGSGSAYQALSQGVPILGFPSNMDQFFVMERIQNLGAGKLIRPSLANRNNVCKAIHELLTKQIFRQCAQKLSEEIKQFDPAKLFKNFINDVLEDTPAK